MEILFKNIGMEAAIIPAWLIISSFVFLRYLLSAGFIYLIFYVWLKKRFETLKIQPKAPEQQQIFREMRFSFYTALIFAAMATLMYIFRQFGYTKHYFEIETYGWGYFIFSIFFLVILHDTYFYWIHRLMHHPKLFRQLHFVHHQSFNPNPMTALSFHPLEALLEFGIVPLIVFIIPVHPLALLFLANWSLFFNLIGHLGYEIFPTTFFSHWFWKWFNTSTYHNVHHLKGHSNYGLYFTFWDRIMGTLKV